MEESPASDAVVQVEPIVRRVIAGRVPAADLDDLVQATLLAVLDAAGSGTVEDLEAYAATAARNAAASHHRAVGRHRRLAVRSFDPSEPEQPEVDVLRAEEADGVRSALGGLTTQERHLVEAHHVGGEPVAHLARREGRSEMAVRLSLARARAKLRVDYVLAVGRVDLPTERCRPMLLALSSGDRRAQQRLAADDHLATCPTCATLLAPATGAHRPAIALIPLLAWWWKGLGRTGRTAVSLGGGATLAAVVAAAIVAGQPPAEREQATATTTTTAPSGTTTPGDRPGRVRVDDEPLASTPVALGAAVGRPVRGTDVTVLEVPTDEGFWIAADDGGRLWVQLQGAEGESRVTVTSGARVTFDGRVAAHDQAFAGATGMNPGPMADELTQAGHHIAVSFDALQLG